MRTPHWPLFDLVVRTPRLELRYPDDELVFALADLARRGIHDPATMPFSTPWTDTPDEEFGRSAAQHMWSGRAAWTVDDWQCPMAVLVDDELVGVQGIHALRFPRRRVVQTGSWLSRARQGEGIGKEMRTAILHLAFEGLGAEVATTSAFHDNKPSLGVTRAVGYEPNGWSVDMRRDEPDRMEHFVLTRERWRQRRRDDITIEGLDACLPLFGLS